MLTQVACLRCGAVTGCGQAIGRLLLFLCCLSPQEASMVGSHHMARVFGCCILLRWPIVLYVEWAIERRENGHSSSGHETVNIMDPSQHPQKSQNILEAGLK
eukprot:Gb_30510 [translate_table: standard]